MLVLCAALPSLFGAIPARSSSISSAELRGKIAASAGVGYSGFAESVGGLALPVTGQFDSLSGVLGDKNQLRVWYRSGSDWRLDRITLLGENDTYRSGGVTTTWSYENAVAEFSVARAAGAVRLPLISDLVPPELGRRLLSEATAGEVSRIGAKRIAGHDALGLRIRPSDLESTIDRVDLWADASTAIPLRVEVFGRDSAQPALGTSFIDFTSRTPAPSMTRFVLPAGVTSQFSSPVDLTDVINRFGDQQPPPRLAGTVRNLQLSMVGAVGVYGRGITEFVASPMFGRDTGSLRTQLRQTPGVTTTAQGLQIFVGPVGLLLTDRDASGRSWLVAGTVTGVTLQAAARELLASGGGR
ncbi:MAG: hypothetical protein QOK10_3794 [Pseudonocardiales bacterium]|nr:hypothetical protein [Pseudonocardiales bacterium]